MRDFNAELIRTDVGSSIDASEVVLVRSSMELQMQLMRAGAKTIVLSPGVYKLAQPVFHPVIIVGQVPVCGDSLVRLYVFIVTV